MSMSRSTVREKEPDESFEGDDGALQRRRRKVDPDEADDYREWVEERKQKGRKKRREDHRDRRRGRDDGDES